jgi:sugar-specific transcriptional regulator TrmB
VSLERIKKALVHLGLSRIDSEIYIYIANKGPNKVVEIANVLNISTSTVYSKLKKLESEELVTKDHAIYSALPFEEALELLINRKKRETNNFQKNKKLLINWKKEE